MDNNTEELVKLLLARIEALEKELNKYKEDKQETQFIDGEFNSLIFIY